MKTFKKILKSYYKPEEVERVEALERELKSLDNKYYEEHGEAFTSFIYAYFEEGVEVPQKMRLLLFEM